MSEDSPAWQDNLTLAAGVGCLAIFGYSQAWITATIFDYRFGIVALAGMTLAAIIGWSAVARPSRLFVGVEALFWQAASFAAGSLAILAAIIVPFGSISTFLFFLCVSAAPFFLLAVGWESTKRAGSTSAALLFIVATVGACVGLALAPWLVQTLNGPVKASVLAIIVGSGATLLARRSRYIFLSSFVTVVLLAGVGWVTSWNLSSPPHWLQAKNPTEKMLYTAARTDGIRRFATRWEDFTRTDLAAIRISGRSMLAVFTNGSYDGVTPANIRIRQKPDRPDRDAPLVRLPLLVKTPDSVLIVNSATGFEKALAASTGATHIRSLGGEGSDARRERSRNASHELRGATRQGWQPEGQLYDLIYLIVPSPPVPGWSERGPVADHFYTKEAFQVYWRHLKPRGMLAILASEETLYVRALLTAWEVLSEDPTSVTTYLTPQAWGFRQISDATPWAQSHYLFILSKGVADQGVITRVSDLGRGLGLIPLFSPSIVPPATFNIQENPYYVLYHPGGLEPARKALEDYMGWAVRAPLDMTAATDRRPFFFQNIRDLHPYFKALVLLCLSLLAAVFFLSCPAYRRPKAGSFALPLPIFLSYFLCLGTGTALAVVGLIYQGTLLTLSLDRSVAVVPIAMLLGMAASSVAFRSGFFTRSPGYLSVGAAFLVLALIPSILGKSVLMGATQSSAVRIALLAVLAAPIGLVSGILMRFGSRQVSQVVQGLLPWMWVTLGLALLLGTAVAFWITQMRGWPTTWALSIGCYMLTAFSAVILSKYRNKFEASGLPRQPKPARKANALKLRAGKRRG